MDTSQGWPRDRCPYFSDVSGTQEIKKLIKLALLMWTHSALGPCCRKESRFHSSKVPEGLF